MNSFKNANQREKAFLAGIAPAILILPGGNNERELKERGYAHLRLWFASGEREIFFCSPEYAEAFEETHWAHRENNYASLPRREVMLATGWPLEAANCIRNAPFDKMIEVSYGGLVFMSHSGTIDFNVRYLQKHRPFPDIAIRVWNKKIGRWEDWQKDDPKRTQETARQVIRKAERLHMQLHSAINPNPTPEQKSRILEEWNGCDMSEWVNDHLDMFSPYEKNVLLDIVHHAKIKEEPK